MNNTKKCSGVMNSNKNKLNSKISLIFAGTHEVATAAVNGELQNHHPCSWKICPKSSPKLQTQNHWL